MTQDEIERFMLGEQRRDPHGFMRSLACSSLKCDYGWDKCMDSHDQQVEIDRIIDSHTCWRCAAREAAHYIWIMRGNSAFLPRLDGKPNTCSVERDLAEADGHSSDIH